MRVIPRSRFVGIHLIREIKMGVACCLVEGKRARRRWMELDTMKIGGKDNNMSHEIRNIDVKILDEDICPDHSRSED